MEKLSLEKDVKSNLNLYLFICRPVKVYMSNESVLGVFAYNLEQAFAEAQRKTGLVPELKGRESVKKMLEGLNLPSEVPEVKFASPKLEVELDAIRQNILFAANEKVVAERLTKRDINDLKRVAGKI